jgi:hypothetical protein
MAARGVEIIDRVVVEQMGGVIKDDTWIIPDVGDSRNTEK